MSSIPSLSSSALAGIQAGFTTLDRAVSDINQAALTNPPTPDPTAPPAPPTDTADLTHASAANFDPTVTGVFDLSVAKFQVDVGAVLLNYDHRTRQTVYDLLGP